MRGPSSAAPANAASRSSSSALSASLTRLASAPTAGRSSAVSSPRRRRMPVRRPLRPRYSMRSASSAAASPPARTASSPSASSAFNCPISSSTAIALYVFRIVRSSSPGRPQRARIRLDAPRGVPSASLRSASSAVPRPIVTRAPPSVTLVAPPVPPSCRS